MKAIKKILVAGGDMRQIYCAQHLAEKFETFTLGFDKCNVPAASPSMAGEFDWAVLPVQPPDSKGNIPTSLYSGELSCQSIGAMLKKDAVVFVGLDDPRYAEIFPGHRMIPYMNDEALALRNAVSTAEGAVYTALRELPETLNGMSVLIAGLGRIGTSLAMILKGFGAHITAAVKDAKGAAKARQNGISSVMTEDIDGRYGLVFNTVPRVIFTADVIKRFPKNTLFIDLASSPGGFDLRAAEGMGYRVIQALGLPGKTAPVTAGTAVAETITELLERSDAYE